MADPVVRIDQTPEWQALQRHHQELKDTHLRELFAADPDRGQTMTCEAGDLYLDWSKQRVTAETVRLLVVLAERAGLRERIDAMFAGQRINVTENRAVLHVALRAPGGASIAVDGHDVDLVQPPLPRQVRHEAGVDGAHPPQHAGEPRALGAHRGAGAAHHVGVDPPPRIEPEVPVGHVVGLVPEHHRLDHRPPPLRAGYTARGSVSPIVPRRQR